MAASSPDRPATERAEAHAAATATPSSARRRKRSARGNLASPKRVHYDAAASESRPDPEALASSPQEAGERASRPRRAPSSAARAAASGGAAAAAAAVALSTPSPSKYPRCRKTLSHFSPYSGRKFSRPRPHPSPCLAASSTDGPSPSRDENDTTKSEAPPDQQEEEEEEPAPQLVVSARKPRLAASKSEEVESEPQPSGISPEAQDVEAEERDSSLWPPNKRRCCTKLQYARKQPSAAETPQDEEEETETETRPASGRLYPWQDAVHELDDKYTIGEEISHGTFSQVYLAEPREAVGFRVALKCIHASSTSKRVLNEVQALVRLGGKNHVIPLLLSHRHHDGTNTLVLPFIPHKDFRSYFRELNVCQVREYMKALLESLQHIHAESILHRDIKPSNFLYDIEKKDFMLVDFGLCENEDDKARTKRGLGDKPPSSSSPPKRLADFSNRAKRKDCFRPDSEFMKVLKREVEVTQKLGVSVSHKTQLPRASRAGTRGFRAPEILLKVQRQTSAIDMWSAGVILLSILSRRFPFFQSNSDEAALVELSHVFGSDALQSAAARVGRVLTLPALVPPQNLVDVCQRLGGKEDPEGEAWPEELYDLLNKLLELVPSKRISAKEALNHAFFTKL